MKKIIVAGGGHGGIATASILASRGFDVTVYEKHSRSGMGYDWTDIFDKKGFAAAEIPMPGEDKYKFKSNMTFYGPELDTPLIQNVPEDQLEIQMERKDIYEHLIFHAEENGVKFVFDTEVISPIVFGNRVVGINTSKGAVYADLVIDACGVHSPVRKNLPEFFGIQPEPLEYEEFYVYRAFFNKLPGDVTDKYKVILLYENKLGITWVADEENHKDILIGRFEAFDIDEANRTIDSLRKDDPTIGNEILRGGQFVNIPVRQPLGLMVADGYAAIGDCAFMTVPIIGSGIANSLKASKILADTITNDQNGEYTSETLWDYQKLFFKNIGNGLAPLAAVKLLLTKLEGEELTYIINSGILTADDMTIGADDTSLSAMFKGMKIDDVVAKLKGVISNKNVLLKVIGMVKTMAKCISVISTMPQNYNRSQVSSWVKRYNNAFKR